MTATAHLLNKLITLQQPDDGFKVTTDTVMAAAACPAKSGQTVLDAGCGVGGISFCIAHRIENLTIKAIDKEQVYIDCARENLKLNSSTNIDFECISLTDFKQESGFDHVVTNPPFFEHNAHLAASSEIRAGALGYVEEDMDLERWIKNCTRLLKSKGVLTIIHMAEELDDLLKVIKGPFGAIEIIPLWPKEGREAKRVIVRAVKDRKTGLRLLSGLVLHQEDGSYTAEADEILKNAKDLFA